MDNGDKKLRQTMEELKKLDEGLVLTKEEILFYMCERGIVNDESVEEYVYKRSEILKFFRTDNCVQLENNILVFRLVTFPGLLRIINKLSFEVVLTRYQRFIRDLIVRVKI